MADEKPKRKSQYRPAVPRPAYLIINCKKDDLPENFAVTQITRSAEEALTAVSADEQTDFIRVMIK